MRRCQKFDRSTEKSRLCCRPIKPTSQPPSSRLLSGEGFNPSREALILLGGWGLELAMEEVDELLMAADCKPLVLPASLR